MPLAAGIFAPLGIILRPEIAAISMSGSSLLVALNALLLRRLRLPNPGKQRSAGTGSAPGELRAQKAG